MKPNSIMMEIKMMNASKAGVVAVCALSASMAAAAETIVNTPPAGQIFETSAEGVGFAPLQGDRFAGPYMAMVRLPAGLVSPAHAKSANMFGVVVSGVLTHRAADEDAASEVRLPAGSWYRIPAGLAHVSSCVSAQDCVTFLYQDGRFDFLPVADGGAVKQ